MTLLELIKSLEGKKVLYTQVQEVGIDIIFEDFTTLRFCGGKVIELDAIGTVHTVPSKYV